MFISSSVARVTGDKTTYIKNRGFKDAHYKEMILNYIGEYKEASRADIDKLILDILPDILDNEQKKNKVKNILFSMSSKDKTIKNQGNNRNPVWVKV